MTDDRELARHLLGTVLTDEPPLHLRSADLAATGRRHRRRRITGAAVGATAGLGAAVLLATTLQPGAPPGRGTAANGSAAGTPTTATPTTATPTPTTATPTTATPTTPAPDRTQPPGAEDVLTPAQERRLVRDSDATFRHSYHAPPGWRVSKWVSFIDDPAVSDALWNGGVEIRSAGGKTVTVLVILQRAEGATCGTHVGLVFPAGAVPRGKRNHLEDASWTCAERGGGVLVSAVMTPGPFGTPLPRAEVPADLLPADEPPGSQLGALNELTWQPGFRWPTS